MVFWGNQALGGQVAVFGLAAYVAYRLIEQNRHALVLLGLGFRGNADALGRRYLFAQLGDVVIDHDPAFGNPLVGLSPRGETRLADSLGQTD